MKKLIPGVLFVLLISLLSEGISRLPVPPFTIQGPSPHPIEPLMIAILLGLLIGNALHLSTRLIPGIIFSAKRLLPIAIVLLGARLDLAQLWQASTLSLLINVMCVLVALALAFVLARLLKLTREPALLIGIGTAICGSSAIVACAPVINAKQHHLSISIATVNLYGTLAIFLFPIFGHALHLTDHQFGVWVGASVQAVPQVIASGFAYSVAAGNMATIVKLVRVILLAPMLLVLGLLQRKHQPTHIHTPWYQLIPPMVIGFVIMVLLNTTGILGPWHLGGLSIYPAKGFVFMSDFLIVMTMAAIGLTTTLRHLADGGVRAIAMGGLTMLGVVIVSLGLIYVVL